MSSLIFVKVGECMANEFDALADAIAAEIIPSTIQDLTTALEQGIVQEGNLQQLQAYAKLVAQYASQFYTAGAASKNSFRWLAQLMKSSKGEALNYQTALSQLKKEKDNILFKDSLINLEMAYINWQTQLNNFLGQTIHSVLLYQDEVGGKVQIFEHTGNFTREMLISHSRRTNLNLNIKELMNQYDLLEAMDNLETAKLDATYSEVQRRAEISIRRIKHGEKRILILWYLGGWDGNWVNGYGPLGEAYANFFFNLLKGAQDPFTGNMESNVATFVRHEKFGVESVDSISALFEGDVSIGADQYHIKNIVRTSKKQGIASAPGFAQGLQIAEYIANIPPAQLSKELITKIQNTLVEMGSSKSAKGVHTTKISKLMKKNLNAKMRPLMGPFDKDLTYKVVAKIL